MKNPHSRAQVLAYQAVRAAKERGDLKEKPCVICGKRPTVAHHANYKNLLAVTWYCEKHHRAVHAKRKTKR